MVTGGQRMNRLRNCGLLLSLVVAACASPGVDPASYDLQGRVDQDTYYSPDGTFSLRVPELWEPGARIEDEIGDPGLVRVSFADDLCREFALVSGPAELQGLPLPAWVRSNVLRELSPVGARLLESRPLQSQFGEAVFLRYLQPGGGPCDVTQIDDNTGQTRAADAEVAMVVLHRDGRLFRFAYFLGISEALGERTIIQRGPAPLILERFFQGFGVSTG
jgi:hypothetical protein